MMIIQILNLAAIILHTPIVNGQYYRTEFCSTFPKSYYCEKDLSTVVEIPKCGNAVKNVAFPRIDFVGFIKQINMLRKEMATGHAMVNNKSFPTVGDMVLMEWSDELEKAAKNSVRHCFSGQDDTPPKDKRSVPSIEGKIIGAPLYSVFDTEQEDINPEQSLNNQLEMWKTDELSQLARYTSHKGVVKDNPSLKLIIYGKQRLIGCGNVFFESADSDPILYKLFGLCYISPASLSTSSLMMLGEKECTACQPKTECAKKGSFAGILCAYSGGEMRLRRNWSFIAIILFFVTLI